MKYHEYSQNLYLFEISLIMIGVFFDFELIIIVRPKAL